MKKFLFTFSFIFYVTSLVLAQTQPKGWVFSTQEWIAKKMFYAPDVVDGLGVLATETTPVFIDHTDKVYRSETMTYPFKNVLRLPDGGMPDSVMPYMPTKRAVAIGMNGPGKILVMCLSTSMEPRQVMMTNGVDLLHTMVAHPNNYIDTIGNQVPVQEFYYVGGTSPIFIYSQAGGIDLFYVEAEVSGLNPPSDSVTLNVRVPEGTQQCWIAGNFNNWDISTHQMKKITENHYSLTLYDVYINNLEYKYFSGPGSWGYVEKDASGEERPNRMYQENDTVLSWAAVYDSTQVINKQITFEVIVPFAVQKLYMVGSFNNWRLPDYDYEMRFVSMLPEGKLFTKSILVQDSGILYDLTYKFAAGADWGFVQTQDDDFHLLNFEADTVRHTVFGFYSYQFSNAQPKDWNIGKMAGDDTWIQIDNYDDPDGLLIMGSPDAPMIADMDEKYSDQLRFTHRLKTEGPAQFNPDNYHRPITRAVAFKIGANAQIAVSALSDSVEGMIFISNGQQVLGSIHVPGNNMIQNGQIPMNIFNYQGDSTSIYLYTENGSVSFYYIGVSDFMGSTYEETKQTYTVIVPPETQQVFIMGDFNNWNPYGYWMERIDSVTFQTTIWGADARMQYKYLNGPDSSFVEVNADGTEIDNRNWNPVDTVRRWMNMHIPDMTRIYYDDLVTAVGEEFSLTIKSATNQQLTAISYQFELYYDPNILEFTGFSTTGTLSESGDIVVNSTSFRNRIYISYMTTQPFNVNGDLVKLNFRVANNPAYNYTQCWIGEFYYDDNQIWNTQSGNIYIESFMLGDVDGNYRIQAYDAALTLQYSVGMDPLPAIAPRPWTGWRLKAADVDGVAGITANDAALILRYSAYIITSFDGHDPDSGSVRAPANKLAQVEIVRDQDMLYFKSYGNLIGFNLFIAQELDAFGAPVISNDVSMSAVNVGSDIYAVGLATLEPFADGTTFMTIPLLREISSDFEYKMFVNSEEVDVKAYAQTGVSSLADAGISMHPNPVKDMIHLNNLKDGSRIRVYDISGRMVLSTETFASFERIDVSGLASGIYSISILNNNTNAVSKFIKY